MIQVELPVQIWSDIACPWCYVGKRHFEAALANFEQRDAVKVTWRAFELDPAAPSVYPGEYAERLAKKYAVSIQDAGAMIERMTETARGVGLEFRFDRIAAGSTFDAHRLLHLAAERGMQGAVKERFLRGYMSEGVAIGDPNALTSMAVEAGLDADEVASVLASDSHADAVRQDEAQARSLGIRGVPFFIIGRYGISGAQPPAVLGQVLGKAWAETTEVPEPFAEGAACGPDGC
jgi:predicted DsbA family dithiol-disulfide isomerase